MLLHHLRLAAIGPFAGDYTIDFDALTADGLFLLDGPTGSGKSTLIDAIVFALYGKVAGEDGDDSRIRSTHSDPTRPSLVELVFSVTDRYFLVRRTPQWERPKQRGEGTTLQPAQATLFELTATQLQNRDWESATALETGPAQVNPAITEIIGLNRKQFGQTVVLPQGEFAQFLELKPEARAALLETLFDTGSYRRFAEKLAGAARAAQVEQEKAKQAFTGAVESWFGIAAVADQVPKLRELHESIIDPDDSGALPEIAQITKQLAATAQQQQQNYQLAEQQEQVARQKFEQEQQLAAALAERVELLTQRQTLAAQETEITLARTRLTEHQRVAPAMQRLAEAEAVLADAVSVVAGAQEFADSAPVPAAGQLVTVLSEFAGLAQLDVTQVEQYLATAKQVRSAGQDWASQLREERGSLSALPELEAGISARTAALAADRVKLAELTAQYQAEAEKLAAVPTEIAERNAELSAARNRAEQEPLYAAQLRSIAELQEVAAKVAATEKELSAVKTRQREVSALLADATAQHAQLAAQWNGNIAAQLAAELKPDSPCPVCGAVSHPSPATAQSAPVTLAEVDAAQDLVTSRREEVGAAEKELESLTATLAVWQEQLEGKTAAELANTEKELAEKLAAALQASQQVAALTAQLADLESQRDTRSAEQAELAKELSRQETTIARDEKTMTADLAKLDAARGEFSSVAARVTHLNTQLDCATELTAIFDRAVTVLQSAVELYRSANSALAKTELSAPAAQAAYLPDAEAAELEKQITDYDTALTKVTSRLEAPQLAQLTGTENVDIAAAQAILDQAAAAARTAQDAATLAENAAADAQRLAERAQAIHQEWAELTAANGPIVRLANLAQARQSAGEKIPLQMWVLIKRFEIVVDRANEHLANISAGRYELVRTTGGERREQKVGLGLRIIDHAGSPDGDVERSVHTLSGGETFFTSLALALALAEVVQEENGGIRIDTLLIDEGFGTLDADTRDTVMRTLFTLTRSGRKVGLISHVEEMKKLIANRVTITPLAGGGSALRVIS
ncbi:MAG: SMC family ATPase [Trueperella sp.]|nr:SMC family ATPase [Trueperella sp.]